MASSLRSWAFPSPSRARYRRGALPDILNIRYGRCLLGNIGSGCVRWRGGGEVRHGGAHHVAFPAQIVEGRAAMHGAAVVPHHEVARAPAMGVDELPLRRVPNQLIE